MTSTRFHTDVQDLTYRGKLSHHRPRFQRTLLALRVGMPGVIALQQGHIEHVATQYLHPRMGTVALQGQQRGQEAHIEPFEELGARVQPLLEADHCLEFQALPPAHGDLFDQFFLPA